MVEVTPLDPLPELARVHGERFIGGGNRPLRLSDPDTLWFVAKGSVDVFATQLREDGAPKDFRHMLRAEAGRLLFSVPEEEGQSVLVAKGLPESELRRIPVGALTGTGLESRIVAEIEVWVSELSESLVRDVTYRPRMDQSLAPGITKEVGDSTAVCARHGVVWVSSQDGDIEYLGTEEPGSTGLVPVTPISWIVRVRAGVVSGTDTSDLLREGRLLAALLEYNRLAMRADQTNRTLILADVSNLQTASAQYRQRIEEEARRDLVNVLGGTPRPAEDDSGLMRVLERIGRHEDIRFRAPSRSRRRASHEEEITLEDVLNASGVRSRRIALRERQRWWLSDSGAMLASLKGEGSPVALIPRASGRYRMFDPRSPRSVPVNARRAATLEPAAYLFYRALPVEQQGNVAMLWSVVFNRVWGDLTRLAGAGILSALATLAPGMLLGAFANRVLPSGDLGMLAMVAVAVVLLGLTLALLQMVKGTALMRLEGRAAARIGAALWDRMLALPATFYRRFTVGDLGSRAMGFQQLRDQVAGIVAGALLSLVFLLPAFAVLFFYDTLLGWLGLGLGTLSLGVTLILGLRQMPHYRRVLAVSRRLTSVLLQLIGGVAKLRVSGAEASAFATWASDYRKQKRAEMRLGALNEHLIAFTSAAPFLAVAALFAAAAHRGEIGMEMGSFLVVYTVFMVFYGAVAQFGLSFSAISAILPTVEQAGPILDEKPVRKTFDIGASMIELRGELNIDHVTFRYTEDGPLILQDVSLHARPGEFIALVGESGSGKSTLLRLAVGLESPLSGAVHYDGHDLERLNRQVLRDGVGMVVQDASLRPQTVQDNIIGTAGDLTVEDAWRAARLAKVDRDISAMPMGMYTVTSEGSSGFSGGQTQRIMLAAALVRNPSVLLLDEATNWLDNKTQAMVMEEIEKLSVTRIVSAHRLSTIRRADRVYVLQKGRVIQQGSFDKLMAEDGVFRDMALRQMT